MKARQHDNAEFRLRQNAKPQLKNIQEETLKHRIEELERAGMKVAANALRHEAKRLSK